MAEIWGLAAVAVIGAGVTLYGASEQKKAQKETNAANREIADETNAENWRRYMLSRGVNTETGGAVNAKLPLWASAVSTTGADGVPRIARLSRTPASQLPSSGFDAAAPAQTYTRSAAGLGLA